MTTPHMQQGTSHSAKQPTIGVLLVHGMNGSRYDFAEMESSLRAYGMVTNNMLLPGHGTHVRDLIPLGWEDWEKAVREELAALKQHCEFVFLIGHSLGGALALHAAAYEDVAGVVSMCAPLYMHFWTEFAVNLVKSVTPVLPTVREDICDPEARRRHTRDVYRWTPLSPVKSMLQFLPRLRAELPQITAPVLVMASVHDHVVPVSDGHKIFKLLGSGEKDLVTLHRSYHVIMKDYDREEVFSRTTKFIRHHASKSKPHRKAVSVEQTDRHYT